MSLMKTLLPVAALAFLAACGTDLDAAPGTSTRGNSALEGAFASAAREYQVPEGLLKAVAYVESRVAMRPGEASQSHGFGVMHLVEREDLDTLGDAARLTGVTRGELKVSAAANVRGAAAVLRQHFDRIARDEPSLDAREAGDWYRAVAQYDGFASLALSAEQAADVFKVMERGFTVSLDDGAVVLAPSAPAWRRHAPATGSRQDALDYPGSARFIQSPNYRSGRSTYEFVVIHTTQGSYSGTVSWFQNTSSQVSAHYVVRSSDGQITQMVQDSDTAWHAQCYNGRAIGIEHEGYVADPATWYTDAMYSESAKLTKWLADKHGIPKDRNHIIGHVEVAPSCNTGGHTDPGTGWNWTKYMGLVTGGAPTASTGTFIGAIYEGGNTANRVAGATVTVNGQSVTTGADGLYQFSLAAGSYTATVTKSGYGSNSVTRTVTASAQVWGSMEINPTAATGTLTGTVYAWNAANPSDTSQLLSGATATVDGQTKTTGADGTFSFTLAPGAHTVTVTKAGFQDNTLARTVVAGQTVTGGVGLVPTAGSDTQAPQLSIGFPADGARLEVAAVQVTGTATDNAGDVAAVKVSLNGGAELEVPVTAGSFALDTMLEPGVNTITVKATDAAGNTGTASATATFLAGVSGFVYSLGDESLRIAGATVTLLEPGTANVLATTTTDANGAYGFDLSTVGVDAIVTVKAAGFLTASETITVPQDRRLELKLGLVAGTDAVGELGLVFAEPQDGATVTTDTVTVYGAARGFDLAGIRVNGVAGELLGGGGFAVTVPLNEGRNFLVAEATGVKGETFRAKLTVNRVAPGGTALVPVAVKGGCSTGLGLEAFGALALLGLLRRRAR